MRKAVRHNKPNKNAGELMSELRQVAKNSDFFIILQAFVKVRVRVFKNVRFFALYGLIQKILILQ